MLQDPFLYSKTVRDNIVIGHRLAADHEVQGSTRAADIHSNIVEFGSGYETMVGERGIKLSGGQRQRACSVLSANCHRCSTEQQTIGDRDVRDRRRRRDL